MLQSVGFRKGLLYQGFQPILPAPQIMGHLRTKEIGGDEAEKFGINVSLHMREQLFVLILYKIPVQMRRVLPPLEFIKVFGKKNTVKDTTEQNQACGNQINHNFDWDSRRSEVLTWSFLMQNGSKNKHFTSIRIWKWGWEKPSKITWIWDYKKICLLLELGQVPGPGSKL